MFDLIANRYDSINRVLAFGMDIGWRKRMVQKIKESVERLESPRILDIATGTADVALLLAEGVPESFVVGVDPSNNMLSVGREKIAKRGLDDRIKLEFANAQDFSQIENGTYDAATMAFGIRNVPDRTKAICEIHRVLRDQGRFCILEFSEPDESFGIMGAGARLFIRHVIPLVGGILSGAPKEYWHLQNSIQDFPTPPEFAELIAEQVCELGSFKVEEIVQMNYGSVQLYVLQSQHRSNNS